MIVKVVSYNPNWINKFKEESNMLETKIREVINKIHHIGSTAIPGLQAKPIIDMILEVESLILFDREKWNT